MSEKRERIGWYFYDWANSAFTTTVVTVFMGPYLTIIAKAAADAAGNIHILGLPVYYGSFFAYVVSLSVILQVAGLPIIGALADYTSYKKLFLLGFTYVGALSTILLFFLKGNNYLYGGGLFCLANICYGSAVVMYNSFLNDIAEPERRDSVSSFGWALGFIGGGVLLLINLLILKFSNILNIDTAMAVRISISSAGIWWAVFALIPQFTLKSRKPVKGFSNRNIFTASIKKLINTFSDARNHPQTLIFLLAYLFYNDGVQAVITQSSQFGEEELHLSMEVLTQVILLVQFVAFFGAHFFNIIAKKTGTKNALIISLLIWIGVLVYVYFDVKTAADFYIAGTAIALVLGGSQALSRSMYSRLIPAGAEAEYFSIYEISERGTSWMSPLLFGLSLQLTHSYRFAVLSLMVFFIIGLLILTKLRKA